MLDTPPIAKARVLPDSWSADQDERLRKAKGAYAKIAQLSDEWHIAETALITRWHLLRSGHAAPIARPEPPKAQAGPNPAEFARLMAGVTPAMQEICAVLYQAGSITRADLARRMGKAATCITAAIHLNETRMAAMGWEVTPGTPLALRRIAGAPK